MLYPFQLLIQLQAISKNPLCISRLYKTNLYIIVVQLLSHVQFWDPILWTAGKPGFPVLHCLPELAQTHAPWVSEAIQPSHSLSPHSPPALNLSQHQGLFRWVTLHVRWPKYWSFSFNISPSNEHSGLISFMMDWLDLLGVQSLSNPTVQNHQFFGTQPTLWSNHTWVLEKS